LLLSHRYRTCDRELCLAQQTTSQAFIFIERFHCCPMFMTGVHRARAMTPGGIANSSGEGAKVARHLSVAKMTLGVCEQAKLHTPTEVTSTAISKRNKLRKAS
jgi:hypothetical protein